MTIIELKDVSKIYEMGGSKVFALDGVSLKIRKGEFLMILGASGSGKSTMMHMVGCLDIPSKGRIFHDGKDITKMSESGLAATRGATIGFVFQTFNLLPMMTVLENIALPMLFQGVPEPQRKSRAKELAELVDLSRRLDHRPGELSGGERQRVAMARALVSDPKIVIADEPTGNLDSKTGMKIMDTLKRINGEGKTIIVVTHDTDLTCYADRVVYLRDGKILSESGKCSRPPFNGAAGSKGHVGAKAAHTPSKKGKEKPAARQNKFNLTERFARSQGKKLPNNQPGKPKKK
ncbi:MAG: ABC transporter ATP-binding protein [Candidatus Aenigmatarchaeota archaeon]